MLADLVPVIAQTRIERRRASRTQIQLRWVAKNRKAWNAYRRKWYASRKVHTPSPGR